MKNILLSGILLFPFMKDLSAVDPTSDTPAPQPSFWILLEDALPAGAFYLVAGGGTVFAASAYLMMRNK